MSPVSSRLQTMSTSHGESQGALSAQTLADKLKLNPDSTQPYYQQIMRQLAAMIDSGELATGENLPPERLLANMLDVSRTTIKHCYDMLREAEKLSSHGRGGTVVTGVRGVTPELGKLKGFSEEMRELGMTPSTRLLERAVVQDRMLASMFGRPSSARFLKVVRLRLADNQPMTYERAWYDLILAPGLEAWDAAGSAYTFLSDTCGVSLIDAEQSIEAVMSEETENQLFGFQAPSPCLLLKRKSYASTRQLAEYVEGLFRGDAYAYRLRLKA